MFKSRFIALALLFSFLISTVPVLAMSQKGHEGVLALKAGHSSSVEFYIKDHLGSTMMLTDSTGEPVLDLNYEAYGEHYEVSPTTNQAVADANNFLYTGQQLDKDIGQYYLRARFYDAKLGHFTVRDPIRTQGGINMYAYVGGNPINYLDPTGTEIYALQKNDLMITGDLFVGSMPIYPYQWQRYDTLKEFQAGINMSSSVTKVIFAGHGIQSEIGLGNGSAILDNGKGKYIYRQGSTELKIDLYSKGVREVDFQSCFSCGGYRDQELKEYDLERVRRSTLQYMDIPAGDDNIANGFASQNPGIKVTGYRGIFWSPDPYKGKVPPDPRSQRGDQGSYYYPRGE